MQEFVHKRESPPTPKNTPTKCGHRPGNADRATGATLTQHPRKKGQPPTDSRTDGTPAPSTRTSTQDGQPTGNHLHSTAGRTQARQGNKPSGESRNPIRESDPLQANPRRSCWHSLIEIAKTPQSTPPPNKAVELIVSRICAKPYVFPQKAKTPLTTPKERPRIDDRRDNCGYPHPHRQKKGYLCMQIFTPAIKISYGLWKKEEKSYGKLSKKGKTCCGNKIFVVE